MSASDVKKRPPQETKEIGLKRIADTIEKNTGKRPDSKTMEHFEKKYEKEFLPNIYDKK